MAQIQTHDMHPTDTWILIKITFGNQDKVFIQLVGLYEDEEEKSIIRTEKV